MPYKRLINFILLITLCFFINGLNSSYAKNRIINGKNASVNDYPWIASLSVQSSNGKSEGSCGGSLIHREWVLTAAHCFLGEEENVIDSMLFKKRIRVILNSTTLDPLGASTIVVTSEKVIIHPHYQPDQSLGNDGNNHDIALIKLDRPITTLSPISLLDESAKAIDVNTIVTVLGWGATKIKNNAPRSPANSLLKAHQKIISHQQCNNIYHSISDNMLCAGGINASDTSDSCQGDSGGPLVVQQGNQLIQVGIVSFGGLVTGAPCGDVNVPGVYTRVSRYQDFIRKNITDLKFARLDSTACTDTILKSNLDLVISCLVYQGSRYRTDLKIVDKNHLIWSWSGDLTPNHCTIATEKCAIVNEKFDLTLRNVTINGIKHRGILHYNNDQSTGSFWHHISHTPE